MSGESIDFYSENQFGLKDEASYKSWLREVIFSEEKKLGEISFVFCDDDYLLQLNQKYLNHDTYTDIISFDNSIGSILQGDIFISTERVQENALAFGVSFEDELKRVLVHGILHLTGFKDKTEAEKRAMRQKEEEKMKMFHVEQ